MSVEKSLQREIFSAVYRLNLRYRKNVKNR